MSLFATRVLGPHRFAMLIGLVLIEAGCASRPGPEVLQLATIEAGQTRVVDVHVATTRAALADNPIVYGKSRARQAGFARYSFAVPPGHEAGLIEWPKGKPDPLTAFAVTKGRPLSRTDFFEDVTRPHHGRRRDVGVFVHGYNQNFQEALFRQVQMAADSRYDGSSILFTWPSQAQVAGYVSDRDSATYSRDALADLLKMLGQSRQVGEVTLLAHSMGGWLTVEALRQLRLTGNDDVLRRLQVVLVSPDIDVDVFRAQMEVIGPLKTPLTVLVSGDDRALRVSQRLGGGRDRVGTLDISDPKVIALASQTGVAIIDISSVETDDTFRHGRYANLASMAGSLSSEDSHGMGQGLRKAGAFVFNSVGATLSAPFQIAGEALAGE